MESLAKQARVVGVTLAIFVLAASYFLLIGPLLGSVGPGGAYDLSALGADTAAKEAEAARDKALAADAANLSRESRQKMEAALPPSADTPALIAALDAIAQQAGMSISSVDVIEQKEGYKAMPDVGMLNIALSAAGGDYPAFKRLITLIEHSLRLMDVVAIAMNPRTATYTLNIRAYTLKKAPAPVAAAQ